MDPMSQLAFDLDELPPEAGSPPAQPPPDLPDRDRAAAVAKLAALIARFHTATGCADDQD